VLYRSNLQARVIEEELRTASHAYRVFGGMQFFDRREVKDLAAYLRVLINPSDEVSLRRIINQPPRGIGHKTVEDIQAHAERTGVPFARALAEVASVPGLSDPSRRSVEAFVALLARYRQQLAEKTGLAKLARALCEEAGIHSHLTDATEGGEGGAIRWGNVEHFLGWLERFERESERDRRSIQAFLERVTLNGSSEEQHTGEAVTLSTLHGAKGLEFDVVFLIGCVEGQLPHSRTTDPKVTEIAGTDVEEERRLFYVGVTRARERLYLCRFRKRSLRGQVIPQTPSRFLEGLPEAQIEVYERPEGKELRPDEIAELGREFLRKRAAASLG
jgi:DNA helicase-2/ATP-dependent DNA helicase PcrA